jgi:hypothetical protein
LQFIMTCLGLDREKVVLVCSGFIGDWRSTRC